MSWGGMYVSNISKPGFVLEINLGAQRRDWRAGRGGERGGEGCCWQRGSDGARFSAFFASFFFLCAPILCVVLCRALFCYAQLCAKLRIDKAALVGQSVGAVFALRCAREEELRDVLDGTTVCLVSPWVPLAAPGVCAASMHATQSEAKQRKQSKLFS